MDTFHTYFKGLAKVERDAFATKVGTSVAYLWQIAYKQRRCAESLAIEIEKASAGAVRVEDLRPDVDWAYIRSSAQSIADSDIVERVKASDDAQNNPGGASSRKTKEAKRRD
jgi:DNA-binding transcriptional regulator YdaS (Cro superfamily)